MRIKLLSDIGIADRVQFNDVDGCLRRTHARWPTIVRIILRPKLKKERRDFALDDRRGVKILLAEFDARHPTHPAVSSDRE